MRNKGNLTKKVAALLLSGVTLLSGTSPAIAEEPSASASPAVTASAQAVETMPAETAAPVPEETESPTAKPAAEAPAPAETAAPSASAAANTEDPSGTSSVKTADPATASASAEPVQVKVDGPAYNVYQASDIVDYVSAIAAMPDETDYTMTVRSFDDLSRYLNTGVGDYFDGVYTLEFASLDLMNEAEKIISEKLGNVIVRNEAMSVDTDENNTSTSEAAPNENPNPLTEVEADKGVAKDAEETMEVAEEGKKNDDKVVIALIDSGVNDGYADAAVNLTTDPDADANGHGTKMASIIKGWAKDKASILSIKAFNDDGTGSIATVTAAVKYATIMDVDIIHISASILDSDNTVYFNEAIENAIKSGITVVASAGNDGVNADAYTPAKLPGVDTIGAAESIDQASAFRATEFSKLLLYC